MKCGSSWTRRVFWPVPLLLLAAATLVGAVGCADPVSAAAPSPRQPALGRQDPGTQAAPGGETAGLTVVIRGLADTVIAHQTAWIEIRVSNTTKSRILVPLRAGKILGEWRFVREKNIVILDWPAAEELEDSRPLTLGPGETLYELLSPESCFGVLTGLGSVQATCRINGVESTPITLTRRLIRPGDQPSALRSVGSLNQPASRATAEAKLWTMCAAGGVYFDCDEALYTVASDRLLVAPQEGAAVVDTLVARAPGSGWCRAALLELSIRLAEAAARKEIDAIVARKPGGVAEAYARELVRRRAWKEAPLPGFKRKK